MRFPSDEEQQRVWVTKQNKGVTCSAFPNQTFFAVEYDEKDAQLILEFADKCREFEQWCGRWYEAKRMGAEAPKAPVFIHELLVQRKPRKTRNAKEAEAQPSEEGSSS